MDTIIKNILDLAVQIQQIPAPTFQESIRAAFVRENFRAEGLIDIEIDGSGNVYGRLPGRGSAPPTVVSAHLDTVFPQATDLKVLREPGMISGPGIGDNSVAVAGLFGLIWALREQNVQLPGDLWLVANTGEEGLGDLVGMRAVVDRFESLPTGYIVLEGMNLGHIYHRGLAVHRYRVHARTKGGHSWGSYGQPSAIHEIAGLVHQLALLNLPSTPRTTLNVGIIQGGTSINTIAPHAFFELDLRSESPEALGELDHTVQVLLTTAEKDGVEVSAELIGNRPAGSIPHNHPLVQLASKCLQDEGFDPKLNIGSTDANIPLSRNLPAVCIGLTKGKGAHTVSEYIFTEPLHKGIVQLLNLVVGVYNLQR